MAGKLTNLGLYRTQLRVKFVMQGCAYGAGKLVLMAYPKVFNTGLATTANYWKPISLNRYTNYLCVPHVEIDPSKHETYELVLPCVNPVGRYANTTNGVANCGSWELHLGSLTPLFTGTAVAFTAHYTVYVSLENAEVGALTLLSGVAQETQPDQTWSSMLRKAGTVTKYAAYAGSFAFPELEPVAMMAEPVANEVADILQAMGFSKPQAVENQLFINNRQQDNLSQNDGKSTAYVLGSSQYSKLGISPHLTGMSQDEMALSNIYTKYGAFASFVVSQASTYGTLIQTYPVSPLYSPDDPGDGTSRLIAPCTGVALPFAFWAADMRWRFDIVASAFHRCTLLIAWDPQAASNLPAADDVIQALHHVIVNVSGNTTVEVDIPWQQPVHWASTSLLSGAVTGQSAMPTHNGMLYVYVLNPVEANGSTDGIYVVPYMKCTNMRVNLPTPENIYANRFRVEALSGNSSLVSFGPATDFSVHDVASFGTTFLSVKDVTNKASSMYYETKQIPLANTGNTIFLEMPLVQVPGSASTSTNMQMNFLRWFATAFTGYRGSVRMSFFTADHDNLANTMLTGEYEASTLSSYNTACATATLTTNDNSNYRRNCFTAVKGSYSINGSTPSLDIVLPYNVPQDYVCTQAITTTFPQKMVFNVRVLRDSQNRNVFIGVVQGTGDDATFVNFTGWPSISKTPV